MFHCPIYDGIRSVLFRKMSSIIVDFFWLDDYEKLGLCFRSGTFFVTDLFAKPGKTAEYNVQDGAEKGQCNLVTFCNKL